MATTTDIPLSDQIAELKREKKMRSQVYPNWIRTGRLRGEEAAQRTARLDAAIKTLEDLNQGRLGL